MKPISEKFGWNELISTVDLAKKNLEDLILSEEQSEVYQVIIPNLKIPT